MYRLYAALLAAAAAVGLLCMLLVSQSNRVISAEAKRYLSELSLQATNKMDSGIRNELGIEGCDMVQGYIFAKPMPTAEFEEYLERIGCT